MKALSRKIAIGAVLASVALVPAAFAQTPVQQESWSITLPAGFGEFAKQQQTVKSANGDIQQVTYVSKGTGGSAVIVTYGQMTGKILDPTATMNGGRDSLLKSLGAKLENEAAVEIDGKPGLSISYSAEKPRPIFARTDLVVAGPRMYQVIYLGGSAEALASEGTQQMFKSFDVNESAIEKAEQELAANAAAAASAAPTPNQ
ncbi:MAG TPA: hypothetical protein VFV54_10405 [Thermoanaerobaculia bacterium]|nr:hypothetical protein [Thermoanaerobaculia bacterium]